MLFSSFFFSPFRMSVWEGNAHMRNTLIIYTDTYRSRMYDYLKKGRRTSDVEMWSNWRWCQPIDHWERSPQYFLNFTLPHNTLNGITNLIFYLNKRINIDIKFYMNFYSINRINFFFRIINNFVTTFLFHEVILSFAFLNETYIVECLFISIHMFTFGGSCKIFTKSFAFCLRVLSIGFFVSSPRTIMTMDGNEKRKKTNKSSCYGFYSECKEVIKQNVIINFFHDPNH